MHHLDERTTHFLAVDDDYLGLMNVEQAFARTRYRHHLWTASDGHEALALLRSDAMPATRRVILLDAHMPRMDGLSMLRELRADPCLRLATVLMLTSSTDPRDRADAFHLNVAGYVVKPIRFAAFVELITAICRYWTVVDLP
ncbi:MAG: response regulator [Myxococcales bacterium]|nr:response regulator [Myxococcales bacterium]MBK7196073.1 response regulator [Myxococcales bacterium]MBP6844049.1 response regulator [Kofleriaceae bacterium]